MALTFKSPSEKEFEHICAYIAAFELDNRELLPEQFTVALRDKELVGFGRLRKHSDCTELCSLGVVTPYRRKGIGKAIVKELIRRNNDKLYLACIIPEFFAPFGFHVTENYPASMQNKLQYCTQQLVVPETYVAMELR